MQKKAVLRTPRREKECTACGDVLPKNKEHWGLLWEGKDTGMCQFCLITIRKHIGHYVALGQDSPPLPRKVSSITSQHPFSKSGS